MTQLMTALPVAWQDGDMSANSANRSVSHLGRTMKLDREAHHLTLRAFAAEIEHDYSTLSRVETGRRPMNEALAVKCDSAFPERRGWYLQYLQESREWTPAGFRDWRDFEDKATVIQFWAPGVIHGMLQTPDYAHALLKTVRSSTVSQINARLNSRMQRQQRILYRPEPPQASFVVDELALYRCVGSPEVMAAQCRHLIEASKLAHVTLQVLRAVEHAVTSSNLMVTESAAFAETSLGGYVHTDAETVTTARQLMASITGECYPVSASLVRIERMEQVWTGVRAATATPKAATA
jgi:hypothetical protein